METVEVLKIRKGSLLKIVTGRTLFRYPHSEFESRGMEADDWFMATALDVPHDEDGIMFVSAFNQRDTKHEKIRLYGSWDIIVERY